MSTISGPTGSLHVYRVVLDQVHWSEIEDGNMVCLNDSIPRDKLEYMGQVKDVCPWACQCQENS